MGRKYSYIWKHFEELNYGKLRCNVCKKIIKYDHVRNARLHAQTHGELDEEHYLRWKNDIRHNFVWQYFLIEDGYIVRCILCNNKIRAYNKVNMDRHLYTQHSNVIDKLREEFTGTWLSRYFDFANDIATCKRCRNRIKIIRGRVFLKRHLSVRHCINKNSECKEKTEDVKEDGMVLQAVDETNNAGPSAHDNKYVIIHDDILRQSLTKLYESQHSITYQGENVLRSYLERYRNITVHPVKCGERTGDNNECKMVQQFVNETDNVGLSSHNNKHVIIHNDVLWQILRSLHENQHGIIYQGENVVIPLEGYHNINVYPVRCEERTGDTNEFGLVQQSVNETNNVGPSFHDNNKLWIVHRSDALWQHFANLQESQKREQL